MANLQPVPNSQLAPRPSSVKMSIHTGMLESLGINMYTSIAKSLVEFIANGFDAEASTVTLFIPFDKIEAARSSMREQAKKEVEDGKRDEFKKIYETLPEDIEIVIEDNGHGMSVEQLEGKFLIVNRNRRKAEKSDKSENGLRTVMGRKGLGKLAGFGVAEQVIVRTKRKGETYATTITMDFEEIRKCEEIGNVVFKTLYENNLDSGSQGTKITLKKLRCDSLKSKEENISEVLSKNFYITGDDFKIILNKKEIEDPDIDYEFTYPSAEQQNTDGLATYNVQVYPGFEYPILYNVKFRARASDVNDGKVRGSLPAYMRGARVYCNKRLAAGPTLFNLETGMHNFHSQSYMECVIHADVLDQQESDLIGTNRSALKTDNEVVDAFVNSATDLMRLALYEHGRFRDKKVEAELQQNPLGKAIENSLEHVPTKVRQPAKKLLHAIGTQYGVGTPEFEEIAPLVAESINAGEVLIKLIEMGTNPKELSVIAGHLVDLANIEKTDVLKVYRGRRNAINGLLKLTNEGEDNWKTGPRTESDLHQLLKENPWLIKVDYSRYLTSDKDMNKVITKLAKELGVDDYAVSKDEADARRPDLVFLMSDTIKPYLVTIVELKSPNIPLDSTHLDQLKDYMITVEQWLKHEFPGQNHDVRGILIGAMPDHKTKAKDCVRLIYEIEKNTEKSWEVFGLNALFQKARIEHVDIIEAIEKEQRDEDSDEKAMLISP
jgi:hypothetical protein